MLQLPVPQYQVLCQQCNVQNSIKTESQFSCHMFFSFPKSTSFVIFMVWLLVRVPNNLISTFYYMSLFIQKLHFFCHFEISVVCFSLLRPLPSNFPLTLPLFLSKNYIFWSFEVKWLVPLPSSLATATCLCLNKPPSPPPPTPLCPPPLWSNPAQGHASWWVEATCDSGHCLRR